MKNLLIPGLIIGGGLLAYKAYQTAAKAKYFTWEIDGIGNTRIQDGKLKFDLRLAVTNTFNKGLAYKGVRLDILINKSPVSVLINDSGVLLEPKAKTTITIPVEIPIVGAILTLAPSVKKLLAGESVELEFKGLIYTSFGSFPFAAKYPIAL